jgi:hypothetical protein
MVGCDKEIFMQQLNKNLKFPHLPDGYIVSASYYQPMSKALKEFKGKFITLYDLLTTFINYPLPPLRAKGLKKVYYQLLLMRFHKIMVSNYYNQ